jgi:predicted phosphodiesterase
MQISEIVESYMNEMDVDFSNRTLARKIVNENPGLFPVSSQKEIDSVRSMIRYRRAAKGDKNRDKEGVMEEFIREEMTPSEYMRGFIRKADPAPERVWRLPADLKSTLVLSDLHIPHHEEDAINISLDYGFKNNVDSIYLNGDLVDFYKISNFSKDPKKRRVQEEIEMTIDFLDGVVGLGLPVFWKMGNHEDRWNRYLLDNAPELYDVEAIQMGNVFELDRLGIELIESRSRAVFGSLNVIHGHEFGRSFFNPVNPARGLFLRAKTSTLAGHNHQTSAHHENNLNMKQTACFSTGCLCNLSPEYRPFAGTKWNHGAAIVHVQDGFWKVDNFRIVEGRIV